MDNKQWREIGSVNLRGTICLFNGDAMILRSLTRQEVEAAPIKSGTLM